MARVIFIGLILAVVLSTIASAIWGTIIYTVANYLLGVQITFLQAFGGGMIIYFITRAIRDDKEN